MKGVLVSPLRCFAAAMLAGLSLGALASSASAARTLSPRIGFGMGLIPLQGRQELAISPSIPVVYHGGSVMRNVTVHTIFWAPAGYAFTGAPSAGTLGYEALLQQFFTDSAHDSGTAGNVFSVLGQYADGHGAGEYGISYRAGADSIDATDPYPTAGHRCSSPSGVTVCVTDLELQQEIDHLIQTRDRGARGLRNIWFVFLPPDVDTCLAVAECATNSYAGYHSEFDLGHGPTIYVAVPDPLIDATPSPGSDPRGNPEAESSIDTVAHETVEAITDPVGTGWMDPNGGEVGDKCENGSQPGGPLGYAPDGSPYNQVINGHEYLLQMMWDNSVSGCVQRTTVDTSPLPLPTVEETQFSASLRGNIGSARSGVKVRAGLLRAGQLVALASARTRAGGAWGPVALRAADGALHAVGDDRDELLIEYGARGPLPELIDTGNGGDPFTEAGYTGWFDLDNGYAVSSSGHGGTVALGPCGQTGVLSLAVGATLTQPPAQLCSTEGDVAVVRTRALGPRTVVHLSSEDNRALNPRDFSGALVKLTVSLGEPGAVSALGNGRLDLAPTGFPLCDAYLRIHTVRCSGLVPGAGYSLTRRRGHARVRARANADGVLSVTRLPGPVGLTGGDVLALANGAARTLSTLHVAHLRVAVFGQQTQISAGVCQPGDYYGTAPTTPPSSPAVGAPGYGGTGTICPADGRAGGLSTATIAQTDDFSGGQTELQVPNLQTTSPIADETLYGAFIASAQSGLPGPHGSIVATGVPVSLTITGAASRRVVFHAANVDTARGVAVPALTPGAYRAGWVLTDANGDTRTVQTRFFDEG
jgi:hypothetical protein